MFSIEQIEFRTNGSATHFEKHITIELMGDVFAT
jgi:hypothetical protein